MKKLRIEIVAEEDEELLFILLNCVDHYQAQHKTLDQLSSIFRYGFYQWKVTHGEQENMTNIKLLGGEYDTNYWKT